MGHSQKITTLALMLKTAEICVPEVKSHGPPYLWTVASHINGTCFYGQEDWKESAK